MKRQYVAAEFVTPLEWAALLCILVLGAAAGRWGGVADRGGHPSMAELSCQRCGQPVQPPYKKYCSDACRDSYQRAQIKQNPRWRGGVAKRTYRVYDYRQRDEP